MTSSSDSHHDSRRPWQGARAEPRPPTGAAAATHHTAAPADAPIATVAAALLDDTVRAICALDGDWRFVYVNAAMLRLTDRNRDELIGSTVWEAFDGTAGSIVETSYRRAVAEQVRVDFKLFYGPLQSWFDVCAVPRDGLLVVRFEDVTARVETHAALARSEARFQLAANASHDVMWDYDVAAGRLWCSDSFIRTFGYPPPLHAAALPAWRDRLRDDDRDSAVATIANAMDGGARRASIEYRMRASDGRWLHMLDRMYFLRDDDGRASRAVGVLVDITEQKQAEERQRVLVRAAEEANLAKDRFLAMISHELRTPLTAIIGFAELIDAGSSGDVTDLQRTQITRIRDSAWHLVGLVDEVMDYARLEAGADLVRTQPTDVAALVRDVAMLLEPDANKRALALNCAVPDAPVVVQTDPGKLRRIVMNLIGNALKFTDSGAVDVLLDRRDSGNLAIAVRDTGPGISAADRERIFEAFVQAEDTHTRSHGGTGLGLAISRRYARMLGGDVVVDSEPGSGSTFTFHMVSLE